MMARVELVDFDPVAAVLFETPTSFSVLVVGFSLDPAAGVAAQDELAALVVDEDQDRERDGRQPPVELEWVHAETLVHAGRVGQERSQGSLEEDAKVQNVIAHSLVHDGIASGLANDQISPLHDHDRHEERRVAGVLELLASIVSPFLIVRILEIVDGARIPVLADAEQIIRPESILSHDNKVHEESSSRLHHSHLAVGHRD